jgi:hypothetical protein
MVRQGVRHEAQGEDNVTEFWNDLLTKASWEKLQELSKEFDFTLIGGWAVYLWTGKHKSKDIDVVVDYETLSGLREKYALVKNDRLKKYEIRLEKFDVDVYVPFYSRLALPIEELDDMTANVKGIRTLAVEALLILKQGAEMDRRNSIKGQKDTLDILTVLIYGGVDLKKYKELLERFDLKEYTGELVHVMNNFDPKDSRYLDMTFKEFTDWRKDYLAKLR